MAAPAHRPLREAIARASMEIDRKPNETMPTLCEAAGDPDSGSVRIRWEVSEGTDVRLVEAEVAPDGEVYILEMTRRKDLQEVAEVLGRAISSLFPDLPGPSGARPRAAPLDFGVLDALERIGKGTNLPKLLEEEVRARDEDLAG